MRHFFISHLLITIFLCAQGCVTETVTGPFDEQSENSHVKEQQNNVEKRKLIELMTALQNDPEMLAVLNDPAAMDAVRTMDMKIIDSDPRFNNLRNNPRMRELMKLLTQ